MKDGLKSFTTRVHSVERGICPIATLYVMWCYDVSATTCEPQKKLFKKLSAYIQHPRCIQVV